MRNPGLKIFALFIIIISCKKQLPPNNNSTTPPPTSETTLNLTADSVYLYSKEVYFWNTALPDYNTFNPRQYVGATELETARKVIGAVRNYNTNDQQHSYSYATTFEQAGLTKQGEDIDYGFFVKAGYSFDTVAGRLQQNFKGWYVNYVYPGSEVGVAGVKRSWKINKVNGTILTGEQSSADLLTKVFITQNTAADSSTIFEFIKPDGGTQTNTFTIKKFTADPILYKEVIDTTGGKKIGYVVFNRFFGQSARDALGQVFTEIQAAGINELILDLRYNGGGLTQTQDTLANLIAPTSANGTAMYSFEYNQQLQGNNFPLLKKKFGWPNGFFTKANNQELFSKKNTLNLPRVFIIVSDATASASELLINNLRPVMNVQLIGDDNTYGKPVGFFGIDLFQKVTFYPVSFRTINKNGEGDYYTGFTPNKIMYDGVDKNWGDRKEDCLYAALYFITKGTYPSYGLSTIPRSVLPMPKLGSKLNNLQMIKE